MEPSPERSTRQESAVETLDRVDWNASLVRGDLGEAVQQLKKAGKGLLEA
jgi:hypothetical protein